MRHDFTEGGNGHRGLGDNRQTSPPFPGGGRSASILSPRLVLPQVVFCRRLSSFADQGVGERSGVVSVPLLGWDGCGGVGVVTRSSFFS